MQVLLFYTKICTTDQNANVSSSTSFSAQIGEIVPGKMRNNSDIVRINIHKLHKIAYKRDIENDYQNKP